MKGTIEVAAPGAPVDDPVDVVTRGSKELEQEVALIRPLVESPLFALEGQVNAAMVAGSSFSAWANTFAPEEVEIPVGGTVTWRILHAHTISFNAPESARPFYEQAENGSVTENVQGAERSGDFDEWDGTGLCGRQHQGPARAPQGGRPLDHQRDPRPRRDRRIDPRLPREGALMAKFALKTALPGYLRDEQKIDFGSNGNVFDVGIDAGGKLIGDDPPPRNGLER